MGGIAARSTAAWRRRRAAPAPSKREHRDHGRLCTCRCDPDDSASGAHAGRHLQPLICSDGGGPARPASTPPSIAPRSHPRAPHTALGIKRPHKSAVQRSRTTTGTQFGRSNAAAEAARTMLALGGAKAASAVSFYSLALGSAGRIGPFQMERSKERLVRNLTQEGSKNKSDASSVRWKSVFAAGRKLQIDWGEG